MPLAWLKGTEEHNCHTLAEMSDSCTKHGFKIRFSLTVFSLQPSAYPPEQLPLILNKRVKK